MSRSIKDAISREVFEDLIRQIAPPENQRTSGAKFRAGRNGHFSADLDARTWLDFKSGAGGGVLDLVIHLGYARDHAEAAMWLEVKGFLRADQKRAPHNPIDAMEARTRKTAMALDLWNRREALHPASLGARYLSEARALPPPYPSSLAFASHCYCGPLRGARPALLAAVSNLATPGNVFAVQRIFLEPPGRKCSELPSPKMSLGPIRGGGVILGEVTDALVIAEGVESALSVSRAFGLPAIATLGASNMPALEVPSSVRRIIIAPDRDDSGTGERHARALGVKLAARGMRVSLAWAPDGLNDWNDWRMREAAKTMGAAHAR